MRKILSLKNLTKVKWNEIVKIKWHHLTFAIKIYGTIQRKMRCIFSIG